MRLIIHVLVQLNQSVFRLGYPFLQRALISCSWRGHVDIFNDCFSRLHAFERVYIELSIAFELKHILLYVCIHLLRLIKLHIVFSSYLRGNALLGKPVFFRSLLEVCSVERVPACFIIDDPRDLTDVLLYIGIVLESLQLLRVNITAIDNWLGQNRFFHLTDIFSLYKSMYFVDYVHLNLLFHPLYKCSTLTYEAHRNHLS